MALLEVLHFPDPRLRLTAKPVTVFDDSVKRIVADMLETMYDAPGIGLAATQVNIQKQIVVIDVSDDGDSPLCLINPKIIAASGANAIEEGCLSVPGFHEYVDRAETVTVQVLDQDGKPYTIDANGLLAICLQHELDHLNGKLFVDYLSPLKRQRIRKKLEKGQQKQQRKAS